MQRSVVVILFSVQNLHCYTCKHTCSGQISMSDGHRDNGQVLCWVINPRFSLKSMMVVHGSTENSLSDMHQSVSRKPQILHVDVSWCGVALLKPLAPTWYIYMAIWWQINTWMISYSNICCLHVIFMHDKAPAHRAIRTRNFLVNANVHVMTSWPDISPHLN